MAKGIYIEGRTIAAFADIIRTYNHEIQFNNKNGILSEHWGDEDFTLRARSFSLPSRGNETIESNFGGMKQFFPGRPTFSNTVQITFEETESQKVQRFLNAWQQRIYNVNTGHGEYDSKRGTGSKDGIADTITITSFDNSGEELPNRYFFINAWLQNVEEVSIDYSQSEAVRYQATFQYDFYTYGKTSLEFGANATSTVEQEDAGEPKAEASDN
jgi:hypothetical protein